MEDDYNLAILTVAAGHHGHSSDRGDGYSLVVASSGERARALTSTAYKRHDEDTDTLIAATINSGGNNGGFRTETGEHLVCKTLSAEGSRWRGEDQDTYIVGALDSTDGGYNAQRAAAGHYLASSPTHTDRMRDLTGLPKGMDSPRYRALGNAVTTKVIEWIGRRIIEAEERCR